MKNQHFDLGAETVAFVRSRLMEVVGEDPENLQKHEGGEGADLSPLL